MVERHHQLNGHEFEHALGDGEGLGSLACCSSWGCKELDMTERLNNNNNNTCHQTSVRFLLLLYLVLHRVSATNLEGERENHFSFFMCHQGAI